MELILKYPIGAEVIATKTQTDSFGEYVITPNKKYTIVDHIYIGLKKISVYNDNNVKIYYDASDFLNRTDYRELQLNNLLEAAL